MKFYYKIFLILFSLKSFSLEVREDQIVKNVQDIENIGDIKYIPWEYFLDPDRMVEYGVMTGDRWKVTNTIYSIFAVPAPLEPSGSDVFDYSDPFANFHQMVSKLVTGQKSSLGESCDVGELLYKPWDSTSPLYGLFRVQNYYATACRGQADLTIGKYVLGGARYGFLRQFCDQTFTMDNVLDGFKESFVDYLSTKGLTDSRWRPIHTRYLYKRFYPSYVIPSDDLTELHSTICENRSNCNFDDSFKFLSYALCTDPAWIDE